MTAEDRTRTTTRIAAAGAAAAFAGLLVAAPGAAHVSPDVSEVAAGSYSDVRFGVGHGCDGSPTTRIEIQVPEQLYAVTPFVTPGWDIEVETAQLDEPIVDSHGNEITERHSVVTWTAQDGQELPDGQKIQFGISFRAPEDAAGETLHFPTIQVCEEGSYDWIAQWDGTGEEPDQPAPAVAVVAGSGGDHGGGSDDGDVAVDGDTGEEDSASEEPDTAGGSESSSDDDGGSSNALAVAALVVGLGGVALGGAAFANTRSGKA